jgi:hypothetical protein
MDQHPIPQNVTGFQFKLIGKMTVKQFGYVALGVIAAVIIYYLPIGGLIGLLLKTIFLPLFGASGVIIAFVPIDGRPIDTMAGNFFKALFAPNQYAYHKTGVSFSFSSIAPARHPAVASSGTKSTGQSSSKNTPANDKAAQLRKLLSQSSLNKAGNAQDAKETAFLQSLSRSVSPATTPRPLAPSPTTNPQTPIVPATQPTPSIKKNVNPEVLAEKESAIKKQLDFAKKEEAEEHKPQESNLLHQKTQELERQLAEIHAQKQALEKEIVSLKSQLLIQQAPTPTITQSAKKTPVVEEKNNAHVRSLPKDMNKKMGLLVSDTPNVVTGVVKDPRGNVLPNILVEIKDKADNPVRAFKTNALGTFASATPLSPGEYAITLEDPKKQQTFDEIKITLTNQILLPLEITSYDKREQLRKELFN